ncbi:MAG: hypothetical protein K2P81_01900 [Bacteriovoracaceae bacterium]|nr:hypothetical protein [Bacteriovoracaceae bacterium]
MNRSSDLPPCLTCEASAPPASVYTPQQALEDINAGKLKFLGRDLFPGSDQNRTCVFKTERAYVLYRNCMANRKEAPATDIEVISFEGGVVGWYVENYQNTERISKMPRSSYDGTWRISAYASPSLSPDMNLTQLKDYMATNIVGNTNGACWIGSTGGAKDMSTKAKCFGSVGSRQAQWAPEAESFWMNPPDSWVKTHQDLRKQVETVPF